MRPVTSRTLVSGWVRSSLRDSSLVLYLCHESGHQSYRTPSRSRNAIGMVMLHKHNPQAKQQLDEPTPSWTPQLTSDNLVQFTGSAMQCMWAGHAHQPTSTQLIPPAYHSLVHACGLHRVRTSPVQFEQFCDAVHLGSPCVSAHAGRNTTCC
jgi:hypothetical protein